MGTVYASLPNQILCMEKTENKYLLPVTPQVSYKGHSKQIHSPHSNDESRSMSQQK